MSKPRSLARSHRIGRARRPRVSAWQQLNQAREIGLGAFGDKRFVLGIVALAIILGGTVLFNTTGLGQTQRSSLDPINDIGDLSRTTLSGYNSILTSINGNLLQQDPNSTTPAIAISKVPVDLTTVNARELFVDTLALTTACCGANVNNKFAWFLSTSAVLPSNINSYDPDFDPSIMLSFEVKDCNGNQCNNVLHIKTNQTNTLASEDFGCGVPQGSVHFCSTTTIDNTFGNAMMLFLNYTGANGGATGNSGQNGANCAEVGQNQGSGAGPYCTTVDWNGGATILSSAGRVIWFRNPTLALGTKYFVGFYDGKTSSGNVQIKWTSNLVTGNAMTLYSLLPAAQAQLPPQPYNPGGLFGPVISFFISGGVWIVQTILSFGVYLYTLLSPIGTAIFNLAASGLSAIIAIFYNVIKAILNSIGSVLGLGNLGDNLFNLLTQLASAFTTLWGLVINTYSNLLGAGVSFLSALGSTLTNYWTLLTTWLIGLADYLSLFWSTVALFGQISISMLLSFWLLYGALRFSRSMAGGMEWYNTTGYFMMLGFSITLFFISLIINYVIIPIAHIVTSSSTTLGARPKIEVAGTSTP